MGYSKENAKLIRSYKSVKGKDMKLTFIRSIGRQIQWSKDHPYGVGEIWQMEDKSIVQIPNNCWDCLGIKYEDKLLK